MSDQHDEQRGGTAKRFETTWLPRIGDRATAELRRSSFVVLISFPIMFFAAMAASFAFGNRSLGAVTLGSLCVAVTIVAAVIFVRARMRLASAVSEWFGTDIRWYQMPGMGSAKHFDRWCERRHLKHP